MEKVNVYTDAAGEFRWQRYAANGKIVSDSGEGYKNSLYCIDMAKRLNPGIPVFFMGQPIIDIQS